MIKKVIPIVLSLCLIFSISVMAENENAVNDETAPEVSEQAPPSGDMSNRGTPPSMPNGEMPPEGMNRGQRPSGEFTPQQGESTPPQNNDANNNTETTTPQTQGDTSAENTQMPRGNPQFGGQMPGGMGGFSDNTQTSNQNTGAEQETGFLGFVKTYSTPITSIILLALAFIFVIFYRRKNY